VQIRRCSGAFPLKQFYFAYTACCGLVVLLYLKSFAFIVIAYVKEWELHIFIVLSFVDILSLFSRFGASSQEKRIGARDQIKEYQILEH